MGIVLQIINCQTETVAICDNWGVVKKLWFDVPWGEAEVDLWQQDSEGDPVLMEHATRTTVVRHLKNTSNTC